MNIDVKILNKILRDQIQLYMKKLSWQSWIYHSDTTVIKIRKFINAIHHTDRRNEENHMIIPNARKASNEIQYSFFTHKNILAN